jgi:hypothetical protein
MNTLYLLGNWIYCLQILGMMLLSLGKGSYCYKMLSISSPNIPRRFMNIKVSPTHHEYLIVPFDEKEEAKSLGARWDQEKKKWYVPVGKDIGPFRKWTKVFLTVPFAEKDEVKQLGGLWDIDAQKWYTRGGSNLSLFSKWLQGDSTTETKSSAEKKTKKSKAKDQKKVDPFCIVDIDTSGLPVLSKGEYDKFTSLASYNSARIVKLSYVICDMNNLDVVKRESRIIKSDGFPIPNSQFHGITDIISSEKGTDFPTVGKDFVSDLAKSKFLVFHNAEFCLNILKSEFYRYGMFEELEQFQSIQPMCIMERFKDTFGLLNVNQKPKPPSLKEFVSRVLNEELPERHSSDMDVDYIYRMLQAWNNSNTFKLSALTNSTSTEETQTS